MYSPFYTAEQNRFYPYRTSAITPDKIANEMNNLIEIGIETQESMSNTPLKDMRLKYFLQSDFDCNAIMEAFKIYYNKYQNHINIFIQNILY